MRILGAVLLASLVMFAPSLAAADRPSESHQERRIGKDKKHKKLVKRERKQRRKAAKRLARFDRLVERFDANGDGVVGPDEAPPRTLRKLQRFDVNGDGWLDRDELLARPRR